ncbi:solute carrier family 12 member 9-like isoform X2 [Chiloscyllium plagiosum]|uniref:solute carrier family 12 member 9-like isoform X2 n=1 Tax=Chiloscyllium plagiosum TaxID=36176 RepID=UPI001CB7D5EE|nr:solute carrier family 12 member 9-like isoform X2 [Chiloscyllium plagiosum]
MAERTPLLNYRLCTVPELGRSTAAGTRKEAQHPAPKKLSTFFGVVVPTLLSMFSVVVFLRIGFVIGQAGLYQSILILIALNMRELEAQEKNLVHLSPISPQQQMYTPNI